MADISQQIELAAIHPTNYSDNCLALVQRRNSMPSRPSIIVWLLLAATMCADLVGLSYIRATPGADFGVDAYAAILSAQVSAVCVWSSFRATPNLWTRLMPVLAVVVCSILLGGGDMEMTSVFHFLPYFGLLAASLLILLWVCQRSSYWRQRTGVEARWQFSIAHLLGVMTVVALLILALRFSAFFEMEIILQIGMLLGSVILSMTTVFIWSRTIHWLFRLAGVLATAIALGTPFYFSKYGKHMFTFAVFHFVVQASVLVIWLAWGQIVPLREQTDAAET